MDQKEDLISQHDTLKKAYDEAIAQNKLIFEVKETYLVAYKQTGILPDID
jgi:hypothetical protein